MIATQKTIDQQLLIKQTFVSIVTVNDDLKSEVVRGVGFA